MERETRSLTTPVKKQTVIIKDWITGREKRAITEVFLNGSEFQEDGNKPKFKGELVNTSQDITIKTLVVSVDGKTDNVLETVLDMHSEDFEFLITEINKIVNPKSEEELKK